MKRTSTQTLYPTRGIWNARKPQNVPPEHCYEAVNCRHRDGDWIQRLGFTAFHLDTGVPIIVDAAAITGLYHADYASGRELYACAGTKVFKSDGVDWSTTVKTGLTSSSNALFAFGQLGDFTVFTNGVDAPFKYDGATQSALAGSGPALAKAAMEYQSQIILANAGGANRGAVYWSDIGVPAFSTTSSGSANPRAKKRGGEVRGLGLAGTDAFVFFESAIEQMIPQPNPKTPYAFRTRDDTVGASSQQSIVGVQDESRLFFASQLGIYEIGANTGFKPKRISRPIDGTWRLLNKTRLQYIVGALNPPFTEVWWTVSTGSSNTHNLVIVYDYEADNWFTFPIAASYLATWTDGSGEKYIVHGDTAGYVWTDEQGTADMQADGTTVAIDAYFTSRAYQLFDGKLRGRLISAELDVVGQAAGSMVEFNYGYDLQALSFQSSLLQAIGGDEWDEHAWDEMVWADEGSIVIKKRGQGQGARWQYQVRNRVKNNTFRVQSVRGEFVGERGAPA